MTTGWHGDSAGHRRAALKHVGRRSHQKIEVVLQYRNGKKAFADFDSFSGAKEYVKDLDSRVVSNAWIKVGGEFVSGCSMWELKGRGG